MTPAEAPRTATGTTAGSRPAPRRKVLISGAGITGPALAYWLTRYGHTVTVVEKAGAPRGGGYPVDVRGTALEVVRRMGLLPRLRDARIDSRRFTFLDGDGGIVAAVDPYALGGGAAGRDLEIRRGDLAEALYAAVRDEVEFRFDDTIDTLDQSGHGVDITFRRGGEHTFALVVGADGTHSRTRELVFGPEERFHRYLGYCFAGFTLPNTFGLSREIVMWNTPGRAAALYAVADDGDVHALLNFARPRPPFDAFRDPADWLDPVAEVFAGAGWEVPRLIGAMGEAGDLFADVVAQIRLPRWSTGRVALVGDAAYAPSFLTGQGTSLALVGAYMLAGCLAVETDPAEALAAYERRTRPFVTANQDLIGDGDALLFPTTAGGLRRRNEMLRALRTAPATAGRPAHSALTLPVFTPGR
ncbi:FAD-dependent monooxygenase [Streptomyces sp. NPDC020875]|uniref:FAD-dependent monooxygenase n=1 Tax=Streptomyces sp. NPDC020875 TaxID=3154898 RepID=UPI0033F54E36